MICHPGMVLFNFSIQGPVDRCCYLPICVTSRLRKASSAVAISQKQTNWPRICQVGRDIVSVYDGKTLARGMWLDNILDYFTNTLKKTFQIRSSSVILFSFFFLMKFIQCWSRRQGIGGYLCLQTCWDLKKPINKADAIVFFYNEGHMHWLTGDGDKILQVLAEPERSSSFLNKLGLNHPRNECQEWIPEMIRPTKCMPRFQLMMRHEIGCGTIEWELIHENWLLMSRRRRWAFLTFSE
jgi:hypothetical protein